MKKYDAYGLGAALVDTQVKVSDEKLRKLGVEKGVMTLVDEAKQGELLEQLSGHLRDAIHRSGGSAGNSMIATSEFGGSSFMCCKVAKDLDGDIYLADLENCGVDHNLKNDRDQGTTGKCLVMVTPDADRSMSTFLGISEKLSHHELSYECILDSKYVYVEGYLATSASGKNAAVHLRKYAEENDVRTALSFSDPGIVSSFSKEIAEIIGEKVDLIFCNEDEALSWGNTNNLNQAINRLKEVARTFVITLGDAGAITFDGQKQDRIDAEHVRAIDTNGAGDMFAGAFLFAAARGESYETAGRFANFAASRLVEYFGPRLPVKEYKKIKQTFFGE